MKIKIPFTKVRTEIRVGAKVLFEPRDLWVGVYWDAHKSPGAFARSLTVYVCVVPMLPVKVSVRMLRWIVTDGAFLEGKGK